MELQCHGPEPVPAEEGGEAVVPEERLPMGLSASLAQWTRRRRNHAHDRARALLCLLCAAAVPLACARLDTDRREVQVAPAHPAPVLSFTTDHTVSILRDGAVREVLRTPEGHLPAEVTWSESGRLLGWWACTPDSARSTVGVLDVGGEFRAQRTTDGCVNDVAVTAEAVYLVTDDAAIEAFPIEARGGVPERLAEPRRIDLGTDVLAIEVESIDGDAMVIAIDAAGGSSHGGPGLVLRVDDGTGVASVVAEDWALEPEDFYNAIPEFLRGEYDGPGYLYGGSSAVRHDMCLSSPTLYRRLPEERDPAAVVRLPEAGAGESWNVIAVEPAPDGSVLVSAVRWPDECLGKRLRRSPTLLRVDGSEVAAVAEGILWASEEGGTIAELRGDLLREEDGHVSAGDGVELWVGPDVSRVEAVAEGVHSAAWMRSPG